MADAIREAAETLVTVVLNQCGGYLSGPGFEAAQAARTLREALAQQPAQGEVVAYWGAVDSDGTLHMTLSADDANGGSLARQEINDWINEAIAEDGIVTRLVALYAAPPASIVPPPMPMPETSTGDIAEDMRLIGKVMGWNLCRAAMFSIVGK